MLALRDKMNPTENSFILILFALQTVSSNLQQPRPL